MNTPPRLRWLLLAGLAIGQPACRDKSDTVAELPPGMFPVNPVTPPASAAVPETRPASAGELRIGSGPFFSYAVPEGWRVGEDGQFAVSLLAPDNRALTLMAGNAGLPPNYPPARFVYEKLMAIRPESLQLGPARPAKPAGGFQYAVEFDVAYAVQGAPCRGIARCHIAPVYDSCVMAMTAALSDATQWPDYAPWLPLVAEQISATNGAAFGMRGIMQQNLQSSIAYGEAARRYREWSQRNWQQTTDERNRSVDRRNFELRENLGGVRTHTNPYDTRQPLELPDTYQYYWVNRQGQILGTNDPGANPNTGSAGEWSAMPRYQP